MRQASVEPLALNPDGSLVQLEAGSWFVCFVPGIEKQWWHPFAHRTHKHVFAIRPIGHDEWTVFEPWWTRLRTATIGTAQAMRFLQWGAEGDVLLVRESIPGYGSQLRGWMNCSSLATYLLGRPYRGARKPFCLHCCRDLPRPDRSRVGRLAEAHQPPGVSG